MQFVPVIAVKCDAELMPEVKPLLSKSAKRRQRQKLKEESSISVDIHPSSEESSPCVPTSAPCGPASTSEVQRAKKRARKDLEHSDSLPAVFSASYMHKKWTVLKDSILQVSEQLYRLNANFEIDRNTGLRVLTRMNMAQIYDLAMCEVGMARAIGDQHVEEEIRATCATFQLEEGDDRDALSAILYDRYILRAMRRYFVYFDDDKYLEREKVIYRWFQKEEECYNKIQTHITVWTKEKLRTTDLTVQLEHHNKLIDDRDAEFQCVVRSRLKVERELERMRNLELIKARDKAVVGLVQERWTLEKEVIKTRRGTSWMRQGMLDPVWRMEEEDYDARKRAEEEEGE